MDFWTIRRAALGVTLGFALVACNGSASKHADGGASHDGGGTSDPGTGSLDGGGPLPSGSDGASPAAAWDTNAGDHHGDLALARADGLPSPDAAEPGDDARSSDAVTKDDAGPTQDGRAQADAPLTSDAPADGPVEEDVPAKADGPGTGDVWIQKDGPASSDGPAQPDSSVALDIRPAPDVFTPSDGPAQPDAIAPADLADAAPATPEVRPGEDSAGPSYVTLAVVGDPAEKGRTSHSREVAALISTHAPPVAGLLIPGDTARYDGVGTLFNFIKTYFEPAGESNFGQFENIVFPQTGNHEYLESNAQGYFDYFADRLDAIAALPSYHGSANTVGRGWYSVDINGWHVVSLNANCSKIPGGCSTGGTQEQWLVADLAQHAGMPTIAYWHQPRWTCTTNGHSSDSATQPLWAALHQAGADFVFNGHNHFYQRYKPLDKDGATVTSAGSGLTEIIVGIGGSSTYKVCSQGSDDRVARALDGDASLGSFFLTLGSDGSYRWEYQLKSDGSVFDSGSGLSNNAP